MDLAAYDDGIVISFMCNFTPLGARMSIARFWYSRGFLSFFTSSSMAGALISLSSFLFIVLSFSHIHESRMNGTARLSRMQYGPVIFYRGWVRESVGLQIWRRRFCLQWVLVGDANGRIGWRAVVYPMPWTSLFVSF